MNGESDTTNRQEHTRDLLNQIKQDLIAFKIVNWQGEILGIVEDIQFDANQNLNLLVSLTNTNDKSSLYVINSDYIQKLDLEQKTLIVDVSVAELDNLFIEQIDRNRNNKQLASDRQKEPIREIVDEKSISLLEEKLLVNRNKQKVGEVVVRKKIETRMVQVPVRREVLIVEQIGGENKQLAQIDIGKGEITGVEIAHVPANIGDRTIEAEFLSPGSASDFLKAIALTKNHGCVKVNIELTVNNQEKLEVYQKMLAEIKTFNS